MTPEEQLNIFKSIIDGKTLSTEDNGKVYTGHFTTDDRTGLSRNPILTVIVNIDVCKYHVRFKKQDW